MMNRNIERYFMVCFFVISVLFSCSSNGFAEHHNEKDPTIKLAQNDLRAFRKAYKKEKAIEDRAEARRKKEEEKRLKREMKETQKMAVGIYRKALDLYKIKEYSGAQEKLAHLKAFISERSLSEGFLRSINKKMEKLNSLAQKAQDKDRIRLKRKKEKQRAKELRVNKKQRAKAKKARRAQGAQYKHDMREKEEDLRRSAVQRQKNMEKKLKKRKEEIRHERKQVQSDFSSGVDALYRRALKLYKSDAYLQARDLFTEINGLSPEYKSTGTYLKRIESDLRGQAFKSTKNADIDRGGKSRRQVIRDVLDDMSDYSPSVR